VTIIYIHGVKVRSSEHGVELGKSFRHWLGAKLSVNNAEPGYDPVYWGDKAAAFRWKLASRPKTFLLSAGGETGFAGLGSLREAGPRSSLDARASEPVDRSVLGAAPAAEVSATPQLASVPRESRADFLADFFLAARARKSDALQRDTRKKDDPIAEEPKLAGLADAAAIVAQKWDDLVSRQPNEHDRAACLVAEVAKLLESDGVVEMGGGWPDWIARAGETLRRAAVWPGDAISTAFAELRPTLNEFVACFIGDVLTYLNEREVDGGPGEVPNRVLLALRRAQTRKSVTGEKIIVVTHSMGGQLFYDAITYFASRDASLAALEVDHWISCGSQVSLFAEMRLLKGQPDVREPAKLPRPPKVKAWTNFYDRNDVVGFIMNPVFDGVSDKEYDTGYGLAFAHTGFLARPSFFESVAKSL
jgi:hypothetical protein